ncbi:MAG: hypothetical protein IH969_04825 [Candidatus Krumholzibacteriota bacterium]|nr:hypothetical protein [Candidatus Krumholzibacteriota bacterium]
MSRFILRLFLSLLLVSMTLGWPATPRSDPSENEVPTNYPEETGLWVSISTTSGNAPLAVRIAGVGQSGGTATSVFVVFDGTEYFTAGMWGVDFDFTHVFTCPGTFEIRAWISGDTPYLHTWTVEVTGEPEPFTVVPQVRTSGDLQVRVEYFDVRMPERITRSTIDWGDGTGVEDITFIQLGTHLYSPFHNILGPGEFTVTSINYYGDTPCDPVAVSAQWTSPIVVLPVEATTWGRVKALYE